MILAAWTTASRGAMEPVGLDLEDKAVVVGVLTDTASLNELGATGNRRVQRVDVDHTDGIVVAFVGLARNIAAAIADAHAHGEMATLGERCDVLLGVDQLKLGRNKEVRTGDLAGAVNRDGGGRLVGRAESPEDKTLDIQDDVGNILDHVRDGHELVLRAIDLNSLDGGTLERGQKNATKGVTQRIAVATLERLDGDTSRRLVDLFDLNLRPNEF